MSALLEARILFTLWVGRLIVRASEVHGFQLIQGECLRGKQQVEWNASHCAAIVGGKRCEGVKSTHAAGGAHRFVPIGSGNSLHPDGLAVDLLIIKDGKILNDEASYRLLGEWWEKQFPGAAWGGHFRDPGHFSHGFGGRK